MKKTAVILLNLGGPNSPNEIKQFLFNLFYDKAIINLPNPIRWLIAKIISTLRENTAKKIYSNLGGKSPILEETEKQRIALEKILNDENIKIFISMRYSSPNSSDALEKIKEGNFNQIILLPLYPQFSTTTTGSSVEDMMEKIKNTNKLESCNIKTICCYNTNDRFTDAHVNNIKEAIKSLKSENYRILFSAHSLPEKIIKQGDPYQWQIESSVSIIVKKLQINNLDYKTTYQSKVTPVKWIGPSTEEEIKIASTQKKAIIIVPIAFVSEHSETLVELDIEYAEIAKESNVQYLRVPALGDNSEYIFGLAEIIKSVLEEKKNLVSSDRMTRICPKEFCKCICVE